MVGFWRRLLGLGAPDQPAGDQPRHQPRQARKSVILRAEMAWRDEEGRLRTADAMIRDMSEGGLGVECGRRLAVNQVVDIRDSRGEMARFVVRHCRPAAKQRYRLGLMYLERERRRELRIQVSGEAELQRLSQTLQPETYSVAIRDMSTSGMQIVCPAELEAGEAVKIVGAEFVCLASTRYCRESDDGFVIGLHFMGEPSARTTTD